MEREEENNVSQLPTKTGDRKIKEPSGEISDVLLTAFATLGSTAGAFGGCLVSKLYLNSFAPTACGMLGCMIGGLIMCTVGYCFWMLFRSANVSLSNVDVFRSNQKSMKNEIEASGNYC
jgi:hypothetical protein